MKMKSVLMLACVGMLSTAVLADECANTCEEDHKTCVASAESKTAKQACEDDVKECKAQCETEKK